MNSMRVLLGTMLGAVVLLVWSEGSAAQTPRLPTRSQLLEAQTFWDNRDFRWFEGVPAFDSSDAEINTTYYYRWELVTKHLTYGSPESGYSFTEFIDRPFWSGAYGAISCPAGHQLYEVRWLDRRYAQDYCRYWSRTKGAEPRRYSTWLADAVWAVHLARPDKEFLIDLLPDLKANYEGWEKSHFVGEVGLFWQTGHDDGMEININSRQTQDTVRGAPGYRPTMNSYMYADAAAISRIAALAGDEALAKIYADKAAALKKRLQASLWDPEREFFLQRYKNDEHRDGHQIKAGTLTYETGRFAGSSHGRELIGYVPWQFNLPDPGYEAAWKFLMDANYFAAEYGPTTVERRDPMFALSKGCCWWSGQSWPYATTQTLVAMANLLNNYEQRVVTKRDYFKLLKTYTRTHRKNGRPYIAEAAHPDTGSWEGHDGYNHSEHYFHSGYCDLVITGLAGLRPRDDDTIEVNPLAPDDWDYFSLQLEYRHRKVDIVWDRDGKRYGADAGLSVYVDGERVANRPELGRLVVRSDKLRPGALPREDDQPRSVDINYAVNNSGDYYPRAIASYTSANTSLEALNDGNYWYHVSPPNRWTTFGSSDATDWCGVDFGAERTVGGVKLYVLDDRESSDPEPRAPEALRREKIVPPKSIVVECWDGKAWKPVQGRRTYDSPRGRAANYVALNLEPTGTIKTTKIRAVFTHGDGGKSGLSEFEAWGRGTLPVAPAAPPKGNLALNAGGNDFPKVSASHTSRFDRVEHANDGKISFRPQPHNRWTSYESTTDSDWLAVDFGGEKTVGRVNLYLYDDRGDVQAPESYTIETWTGDAWKPVEGATRSPAEPKGNHLNSAAFTPVKTAKLRVVFRHRGAAKSGVSEIEAFAE